MEKKTRDIFIAIIAVVAAVGSLYFAFGRRAEFVDLDTYSVLGVVAAEETSKLLADKGKVLVVVRDTGADKNPSVEAELKAFEKTLKQHSGMNLATYRVQVTPMLMMSTGGGLPSEELMKALESHPGINALVVFFGFPLLSEPELDTLKKSGAKTVVVSSFRAGYKQLMQREAINLAIVPKPDSAPADAPKPKTVRERFDQDYKVITSADAPQLP